MFLKLAARVQEDLVHLYVICVCAVLGVMRTVRRALCCVRRTRLAQDDYEEQLTNVGVVPNRQHTDKQDDWSTDWGDRVARRPQTVQEHIQSYREKLVTAPVPDPSDEALNNIFKEMAPRVIKQKRVIIPSEKHKVVDANEPVDLSRLAAANNFSSELGEWIDEATSGWDEQQLDADEFIRQQKRSRHHGKLQTTKLAV